MFTPGRRHANTIAPSSNVAKQAYPRSMPGSPCSAAKLMVNPSPFLLLANAAIVSPSYWLSYSQHGLNWQIFEAIFSRFLPEFPFIGRTDSAAYVHNVSPFIAISRIHPTVVHISIVVALRVGFDYQSVCHYSKTVRWHAVQR